MRAVPNEWCKLINSQLKPCPKCNKKGIVTDVWHLEREHGIKIEHVNEIWEKVIQPIVTKPKMKRKAVKQQLELILKEYLNNYSKALAEIKPC